LDVSAAVADDAEMRVKTAIAIVILRMVLSSKGIDSLSEFITQRKTAGLAPASCKASD
jgi:hypothetical protein